MAETQLFEKYGRTLAVGSIIFTEGEEGEQMYIIQEGRVRISKLIGGKEHVLAILGKGDFFGEMAIVNRETRTATATVLTDSVLLAFDRQGFTSMVEKNAKIALNIIDKLCRRLRNANLQIQHLVRRNKPTLVAMNLRYAFEGAPGGFAFDRTVDDISQSLGVPLVEISHILDDFVKAGMLHIENNRITLTNQGMLLEVCGS